jgi:hypothetical protein
MANDSRPAPARYCGISGVKLDDSPEPRPAQAPWTWHIDVNCRAYPEFDESMAKVIPEEFGTIRVIEYSAYERRERELAGAAGEFDGTRAREMFFNDPSTAKDSTADAHSYEMGMKAQFELDRARIGLAFEEARRISNERISSKNIYLEDRVRELSQFIKDKGLR